MTLQPYRYATIEIYHENNCLEISVDKNGIAPTLCNNIIILNKKFPANDFASNYIFTYFIIFHNCVNFNNFKILTLQKTFLKYIEHITFCLTLL